MAEIELLFVELWGYQAIGNMVDRDQEATSNQTHHDWGLPESPGAQASLGVYTQGLCPLLHPDSTETKAHLGHSTHASRGLARLPSGNQNYGFLLIYGTQEVKYLRISHSACVLHLPQVPVVSLRRDRGQPQARAYLILPKHRLPACVWLWLLAVKSDYNQTQQCADGLTLGLSPVAARIQSTERPVHFSSKEKPCTLAPPVSNLVAPATGAPTHSSLSSLYSCSDHLKTPSIVFICPSL